MRVATTKSVRMRTLIVEDDPPTLKLLQLLIKNHGHEVVACEDGAQAWIEYQKQPFPLVISDWVMPCLNGLELCGKIRAHPDGLNTLFIIVTARSEPDALQEVLAAGADDYITKPIVPDLLDIRLAIAEDRVRNITERQESEEQLRQTLKLEAVGRLAGGVAHEFNNMLTIIIGRSQLMLGRIKKGDLVNLSRDIELIQNTGERAAQLTRQLLQFSRQHVQQPRVFDLNAAVSELDKLVRRFIGEHIVMSVQLAPGLKSIKADPGQIEQSIMCLALNARDAMPQGGKMFIETRNVEVDGEQAANSLGLKSGDYVTLTVRDTGPGMDENTRSHVFEPFFTTKEFGKGTGLGLSTVYGIVKHSGGNISVDSEPGRGTSFKIYLPAVVEPTPWTAAVPTANASLSGNETILLVEDEPGVREVVREILADLGFNLIVACDGEDAVKLCANFNEPIQLMITDVVMPRMGGRELATHMAKLRPEMKVLYISGYTSDTVLQRGVSDRGIAFLEKPFTSESLARQIAKALAK